MFNLIPIQFTQAMDDAKIAPLMTSTFLSFILGFYAFSFSAASAQEPRADFTVNVRLADEQRQNILPAGEGFRFIVVPNDSGVSTEFLTNERGSFVIPASLMSNGSLFNLIFAPKTAPGQAQIPHPNLKYVKGSGINLTFVLGTSVSIEFKSNQSEISHAVKKNVEAVQYIQDFIAAFPGRNVLIIGHTDNQGEEEFNLALSKRRALVMKRILMQVGVDGRTISTDGKGSSQPKTENDTEEGRAANRRIEVRIL